jgi:hypothetical protein
MAAAMVVDFRIMALQTILTIIMTRGTTSTVFGVSTAAAAVA